MIENPSVTWLCAREVREEALDQLIFPSPTSLGMWGFWSIGIEARIDFE
jgi:hypothetical protein